MTWQFWLVLAALGAGAVAWLLRDPRPVFLGLGCIVMVMIWDVVEWVRDIRKEWRR